MIETYSNMKRFGLKLAIAGLLLASIPTMTGCQKKNPGEATDLTGIRGEQFVDPSEPRQVHRIFDAAAASGARADATLHASHFDAGNPGALNSLGEQKLDLMLSDDDALPMAIYLNVADNEVYPAREQSVRVYLRDRGLADQQVKIVAGPNTGNYQATAPMIRGSQAADLKKTDVSTGSTTSGMIGK